MIATKRLADIALITMGTAPPGESYNFEGEGLPLIAGAGDYGTEHPSPTKFTTQPISIAEPGDLLICVRATIGDLNWADQRYCLGRGVAGIRAKDGEANIAYLAHFLATAKTQLQRLGTGSTFPAIRKGDLENLAVPSPTPEDQRRIAAILDKADAIRRKKQDVIQMLQDLRSSSFLEMFGDPVSNPKGWSDRTFDAQINDIQYGPRFFNQPYTETGPRIVRITDLDHYGNLDFGAMPRIEVSEQERRQYCLQPGDLILARSGATVGKTALIEEGYPECIAGAYFIRLRLDKVIHPRYAQMVLSSCSVQAIIANQSRQSAQQNFNGPAIKRLPLPTPPMELQAKFARIYDHLSGLLKVANDQRQVATNLFQALVQRAFIGEL